MEQWWKDLRNLPPALNDGFPLISFVLLYGLATLSGIVSDRYDLMRLFDGFDIETLFVFGTFTLYMSVYWTYSLLALFVEVVFPHLILPFKIQPSTRTSVSEFMSIVPLVLVNQLLLGIPLLKLVFFWTTWGRDTLSSSYQEYMLSMPSWGRFSLSFLVQLLSVEFWFYPMHRMLHASQFMFSAVHSVHHRYKSPTVVESAYVHPVEFALNSFPVLIVGFVITRPPIFICWAWIIFTTFLQVHDHSGYWFPFVPKVLMHDYHHQQVKCCFGILGLLDGLCGTTGDFVAYQMKCANDSVKQK